MNNDRPNPKGLRVEAWSYGDGGVERRAGARAGAGAPRCSMAIGRHQRSCKCNPPIGGERFSGRSRHTLPSPSARPERLLSSLTSVAEWRREVEFGRQRAALEVSR